MKQSLNLIVNKSESNLVKYSLPYINRISENLYINFTLCQVKKREEISLYLTFQFYGRKRSSKSFGRRQKWWSLLRQNVWKHPCIICCRWCMLSLCIYPLFPRTYSSILQKINIGRQNFTKKSSQKKRAQFFFIPKFLY